MGMKFNGNSIDGDIEFNFVTLDKQSHRVNIGQSNVSGQPMTEFYRRNIKMPVTVTNGVTGSLTLNRSMLSPSQIDLSSSQTISIPFNTEYSIVSGQSNAYCWNINNVNYPPQLFTTGSLIRDLSFTFGPKTISDSDSVSCARGDAFVLCTFSSNFSLASSVLMTVTVSSSSGSTTQSYSGYSVPDSFYIKSSDKVSISLTSNSTSDMYNGSLYIGKNYTVSLSSSQTTNMLSTITFKTSRDFRLYNPTDDSMSIKTFTNMTSGATGTYSSSLNAYILTVHDGDEVRYSASYSTGYYDSNNTNNTRYYNFTVSDGETVQYVSRAEKYKVTLKAITNSIIAADSFVGFTADSSVISPASMTYKIQSSYSDKNIILENKTWYCGTYMECVTKSDNRGGTYCYDASTGVSGNYVYSSSGSITDAKLYSSTSQLLGSHFVYGNSQYVYTSSRPTTAYLQRKRTISGPIDLYIPEPSKTIYTSPIFSVYAGAYADLLAVFVQTKATSYYSGYSNYFAGYALGKVNSYAASTATTDEDGNISAGAGNDSKTYLDVSDFNGKLGISSPNSYSKGTYNNDYTFPSGIKFFHSTGSSGGTGDILMSNYSLYVPRNPPNSQNQQNIAVADGKIQMYVDSNNNGCGIYDDSAADTFYCYLANSNSAVSMTSFMSDIYSHDGLGGFGAMYIVYLRPTTVAVTSVNSVYDSCVILN